jgi:hypothetical protein
MAVRELLVRASACAGTLALGVGVVAGSTAAVAAPVTAAAPPSAWGGHFPVDQNAAVNGITAVSCATTTFCMAVDGAGRAMSFTGSGWSKPKSIDADSTGFTGLSCRSMTFCIATDTNGFATVWDGKRWSAPRQIDPTQVEGQLQLYVSCPAAKFCAAADSSGYVLTSQGSSWKRHLIEDKFGNAVSFTGISCSSSSFCAAVTNDGEAVTMDGGTWSKVTQTSAEILNAVSCVSAEFCVAVGDGALTYEGKSWSPHQDISPVQLGSVSCVSTKDCVAGDELGSEYRWNGRWAAGKSLSPDDSLNAISCRTSSFCAVVTANGNAVFYDVEPYLSTSSLPAATVGRSYSVALKAVGGVKPYSLRSVKGMPAGLAVSRTGLIAGKPSKAGKYEVTFAVGDPLHISSTRVLELTVAK